MSKILGHYSDYYGDATLAQWRKLGARDKATNVTKLWALANKDSVARVADIGCGDGAIIHELGHRGLGESYVGFDISESGISYARQRQYAKPSSFKLFSGAHLPADDKSFDLAILSHVVEHLEEPRLLLAEAARIATHVFVEVPLELNVRTKHDFHWTAVGHINLYNPVVIRHLMQSIGLHILAEKVTCPSRAVITFKRPGLRGALHWGVKAMLLKTAPFAAWRLLTYHGSLLATTEKGE